MATMKLHLGKGKKDKVNILVQIRDGRNIDIKWTSPLQINTNYWDENRQTIKVV